MIEKFGCDQRCKENMLVQCTCGDDDHIMIWKMDDNLYDYDKDPNNPPEFFIGYHLNHHKRLWDRIIISIKYIFGFKSKFGHFGECVLNIEDSVKLTEFIEKYKTIYQKWYFKKKLIKLFNDKLPKK